MIAKCTRRYEPAPSEFSALVAAINTGVESELESAIGRIAKGALAAKRKPRAFVRKPKVSK
jgi:hypothetical protein